MGIKVIEAGYSPGKQPRLPNRAEVRWEGDEAEEADWADDAEETPVG
jgi:hypothetical protein